MCSFGRLLGGQLGGSLHYVIAISLFGVFVMCGRFFLPHLFFGYYLSAPFTLWGSYGCRGRVTGSKPNTDY